MAIHNGQKCSIQACRHSIGLQINFGLFDRTPNIPLDMKPALSIKCQCRTRIIDKLGDCIVAGRNRGFHQLFLNSNIAR